MNLFNYSPTIEERIRNIVRTEEPVTVQRVAKLCRGDISITVLDQIVCEMVRDGLLRRVWDDDRFENLFAAERFELR